MAADSPADRRWHPPLLILAGFILCWFGLRALGASYTVTRWPVIPARVVHSAVDSVSSGRFRPRVVYEFFLAGRRLVGTGIDRPATLDDSSQPGVPFEQATAMAARYPVGLELLAGYDPVNPLRTVLRPRFNWWTTVPVLVGTLLGALGIMILLQQRRTTAPVSTS